MRVLWIDFRKLVGNEIIDAPRFVVQIGQFAEPAHPGRFARLIGLRRPRLGDTKK